MTESPFLIVGNWKMHGTRAEAATLVDELQVRHANRRRGDERYPEVVLCPPYPLLDLVHRRIRPGPFRLGAQDCSSAPPGPRTGEVAAAMLRDAGCAWVLLGHSERRTHQHENDDAVSAKVAAAHTAGLTAIVCVGESASVRRDGDAAERVTAQLLASLPARIDPAATVVAYEPVWAIGTGATPGASEIAGLHAVLRGGLVRTHGPGPWRILYGGSVRADNAREIAGQAEVNGLLVGGASLQPAAFWGICEAVTAVGTVLP